MTGPNTPRILALGALCAAFGSACATEYGAVVSSTPVMHSVPVAQRVCSDQEVVYQQQPSGAGAVIGAIAGAALGNTIGAGAGRAAATGIGLVAGSAIGNQVEANGLPPTTSTVQRCRTVTRYENRLVGYDVVYDYQGVRRSVRLAQDPGPSVALEVNVAPAGAMPPQAMSAAAAPPPTVVVEDAPQVVYIPQQRVYAPPVYVNPWPYYPPAVYIGGGWGWGRGYYGGGWGGHHR